VVEAIRALGVMNEESERWRDGGLRNWSRLPSWALTLLAPYRLEP
jgi:hypothetical protein